MKSSISAIERNMPGYFLKTLSSGLLRQMFRRIASTSPSFQAKSLRRISLAASISIALATNVMAASVGVCPNVDDGFLIRRGIESFVERMALGFERSGFAGADNPYPYLTTDDFVKQNPDCCTILKEIPGDFSLEVRPYLRGEATPYVVAVKINVKQHYTVGGQRTVSRVTRYYYVQCDGQPVNGYDLK